MNSAIIVAGGNSTRFGGEIPKQFVKLKGREILSFSVDTFSSHPDIDEVVIVCHTEWIEHVQEKYPRCKVVEGGKTRQDSSLAGIKAVQPGTTAVLIHDAARPLVTESIISNCLNALIDGDGSAPILDASSSLINLENDQASFVDRNTIKEVQTPQCFKTNLIMDALHSGLMGTDEIGIVLQYYPQSKLNFVAGDTRNFKVTTEFDLKLLAAIN